MLTRDGEEISISRNAYAQKCRFQVKKGLNVDFKLTVTARMSISIRKEQSVNLT